MPKDPLRPFVVRVADHEVMGARHRVFRAALPTSEADSDALDVTLVEGQVSVSTASGESDKATKTRFVPLNPGDRVRFSERGGRAAKGLQRLTMQIDRPHIDQLIAWRRSEAVFDDVPLSEAVAEMHRYTGSLSCWSATSHSRGCASADYLARARTSALRARRLRCTGWSCTIAKTIWNLRRVAKVEEVGE